MAALQSCGEGVVTWGDATRSVATQGVVTVRGQTKKPSSLSSTRSHPLDDPSRLCRAYAYTRYLYRRGILHS